MAFMPHSWLNSGSFGTVAEAVRQRLGSAYRTDGSRFSRAIASSAGSPRGSSTSWTPSRRDPRFTVTPAARRAAARSLPDAPRSKPTSTSPGTGWPFAAGGGTGVAPAAPGAATARHAVVRTASLATGRIMGSARAALLGGRRRAAGDDARVGALADHQRLELRLVCRVRDRRVDPRSDGVLAPLELLQAQLAASVLLDDLGLQLALAALALLGQADREDARALRDVLELQQLEDRHPRRVLRQREGDRHGRDLQRRRRGRRRRRRRRGRQLVDLDGHGRLVAGARSVTGLVRKRVRAEERRVRRVGER